MRIEKSPPIVQQVFEELKKRIQSGSYPAGSKLPAESDLAVEFDVSRASIREALSELSAGGWVERKHGVGTFAMDNRAIVRAHQPTFVSLQVYIQRAGYRASMQSYPPQFHPLSDDDTQKLRLEYGSMAVDLERCYFADDTPVFAGHYLFPSSLLKASIPAEDYHLDIPEFIDSYLDEQVATIHTRVLPVQPNARVMELMRLPSALPLLLLENIFFGTTGTPFALNTFYFNHLKLDFFAFYSIGT